MTLAHAGVCLPRALVALAPLGHAGGDALPWRRQRQAYLGAVAGRALDLGVAAMALHAPDDRTPYAVPGLFDPVQVEAGAAVPDEHAQLLRLDLGVERHRVDAGVPGRVDESLAGRGHERRHPFVAVGVADHHGLHADRVRVLDFG